MTDNREDATVVVLDGPPVTIGDVADVARGRARVELGPVARAAMERSRAVVEALTAADRDPAYGITTGFGALATTFIPPERRAALQVSLVRSHAAGVGPPVEAEVVRAMIFLRARTLAMGASGARPLLVDAMAAMLNAGITPVVPEHGSLGCSGDLAPLAHAALALIGEGTVTVDTGHPEPQAAADALARHGLEPIVLAEKEGLALTNGTDGILGMLCLARLDVARLVTQADIIAGLTVEAVLATDRPFAPELIALRPHPGQAVSAAVLRAVLADSPLVASHREDDHRVQDAYSVRCAPQIHGAVRDTLDWFTTVVDRELAAAIDNPMVLADGRVESCGNFHGIPLGLVADHLAIAVAELGSVSERRLDRMLDRTRSHGLPPFLADDPGVDSGLMIGQYTAAALCAENRRLAAPASVDSIPTSALQEDHVAMAWAAARKLRTVIDNVRHIVAIEWVAAARAVELRAPLQPAAGTGAALGLLRRRVPGPGPDRVVAPELEAAAELLNDDGLTEAVEVAVGPLDTGQSAESTRPR